jgi:putative sporulation protein YyaC
MLMREVLKGLLPRAWSSLGEERVHMEAPDASAIIARNIYQCGLAVSGMSKELILLCIGTDRSIGDALGPLVGSQLKEAGTQPYHILGTLDNPVHASNLAETLKTIETTFRDPLVIAVDACLGRVESIGMLTVGRGSLKPGAGVNKNLPAVGQVYVTGVVNVGGFMEYFVLQNTRLSLVTRMARVAANGITRGMCALAQGRRDACPARES